ncbi:hypothetical protein V6N12_053211 [Hibiscus sabdariffa]|uniref:Uncharacterized protein n=1 Tax=Hibiscus sabdariffa TaxID=183260 RepID=A0ABR2D787_9ROSI
MSTEAKALKNREFGRVAYEAMRGQEPRSTASCAACKLLKRSIDDQVITEPFGDVPAGCGGSMNRFSQNISYELNQEAHVCDFCQIPYV